MPRGAVITPAARDELRSRQIAVASAVVEKSNVAIPLLYVGTAETKFESGPLVASLIAAGQRVEQVTQHERTLVVEKLSDEATRGNWGLLLTHRPAAGLCLANRRRGVRAALGSSVEAVAEAMAEVDANLLVVDPRGKSLHGIRRIVFEWRRGGAAGTLARYRKQLD